MTRIDRYRANLDLRRAGKYPGIPLFTIYPKLGQFIPALPREVMMIFFGATGAGKTQWYKRLTLNLARAHKLGEINTKPLFIINLLEESIEEFEDSLIAMLYYDHYKSSILKETSETKKISKLKLTSYAEEILTEEEFKRIEEVISPELDELLEEYYILEDNVYHPYGLYRNARDISHNIGTHYYTRLFKEDSFPDITYSEYEKLSDEMKKKYKWKEYKLHDSNLHPIVITDHIAKMNAENDKTLHQTLSDWSFTYCRKNISKNWKWNVIKYLSS